MTRSKAKTRKWIRLAAGILAAALVLSMSWTATCFAASADMKCSITIELPSDEALSDLTNAEVVIDFYQIAERKAGTDQFAYGPSDWNDAFSAEYEEWREFTSSEENMTRPEMEALTQHLAGEVLGNGTAAPYGGTQAEPGESTEVAAGLYLAILHGKDLSKEQYTKIENAGGETIYRTLAKTEKTVFSFFPILIDMPAFRSGESGPEWIYDLTVSAKAGMEVIPTPTPTPTITPTPVPPTPTPVPPTPTPEPPTPTPEPPPPKPPKPTPPGPEPPTKPPAPPANTGDANRALPFTVLLFGSGAALLFAAAGIRRRRENR